MVSPVGDDYFSSGKFAMPQNRYALCGFYVVLWDEKNGAEFCAPTPLYLLFFI